MCVCDCFRECGGKNLNTLNWSSMTDDTAPGCIGRARENMEYEKVKKEIINSKTGDFVQHFIFSAESKKCYAKVNLSGKN